MTITNIRYGELGKVLFDYNGITIAIKEPEDVILVGPYGDAAERWIQERYGYLLGSVRGETQAKVRMDVEDEYGE